MLRKIRIYNTVHTLSIKKQLSCENKYQMMLCKQLALHSPAAELVNTNDIFCHDRANRSDTKAENQARGFMSLIYSKLSTMRWKKRRSWEVSWGVAQSAEISQLGQLPWWGYSLWLNHRAEQDGELSPQLHFITGTQNCPRILPFKDNSTKISWRILSKSGRFPAVCLVGANEMEGINQRVMKPRQSCDKRSH